MSTRDGRVRLPADTGDLDAPPRLSTSIALAAFFAAFVFRFFYFYLDDRTHGMRGTFLPRLIEESGGIVAALLLFPAVVWLERRRPLDMGRWRTNWPWHLAGLVMYSVVHTTIMAVSRWTMFPVLGLGPYDYGTLSVRFFMESQQDVFSYATFVGVLTLLRVQQRLQREQLRAAVLARHAAEAQLEALTLRLQPHFLFNALNTISSAIYENPVGADVMIGHLGDLLRHALRSGDRPEIPVAEELEVLRAYLAIVTARFGDRVRCELHVAPEANALAIPAFLLQPLVENAVRHGSAIESHGAHTSVVVRIGVEHGELLIDVENDIAPLEEPRPGSGTGLRTTADRLRLLYGDAHRFSARANESAGRFRVSIAIPAHTADRPTGSPLEPTFASAHR